MKVKKLADGGTGLITFRSGQTPWNPPVASSSKSSKEDTQESLLDDEMYKMLINKGGLKNDVDAFAQKINNTNINSFLSGNSGQARRLFNEINTLRVNKELWDLSLKQAQDLGGLNEVAVGSSGELYVRDNDGNIGAVTTSQFNPKKYKALSVSELLIARQYDPNLVNNTSIFNTSMNSIGMDKIVDHINKIVEMAGKESESSDTFVEKRQIPSGVENQMQYLKAAIGNPSSDVKMNVKIESERGQFNSAFRYIWNTLGRPAQLKLQAVSAISGKDTSPEQIIADALLFGTDYSKEVKVDEQSTVNGVKTSGTGSTSGMENIKPYDIWNGMMTVPGTFLWNDPSTGLKMNLPTTVTAPLIYENGNPIGYSTVSKILTDSPFGSFVLPEKAYFGSNKMSPDDKNKVAYDSSSAARVYLPVDDKGAPDYNILRMIENAKKQMDPNWSARQKNDFYKSRNLDVTVNEKGEFIESSSMKPFLIFYGYAEDGANATKKNTEIETLHGEDRNIAASLLDDVWKTEKKKDMRSGLVNNFYKGIIAIPFNGKYASLLSSSMSGSGPKYKPLTREETQYQLQTTSRGNVGSNQFDLN